mgnify:CR=1 FL=1
MLGCHHIQEIAYDSAQRQKNRARTHRIDENCR